MATLYVRGGTWWASWFEGGRRIRRSLKLPEKDRPLAQVALGDLERRLAEGRVGIVRQAPADLWDAKIERTRIHVAPSTARRYLPLLTRMRDFFHVLTAVRVQEWIVARVTEGASVSTINYELTIVRGMLPPGEREQVHRLKDRAAAIERRPRFLVADEARRLLEASSPEFARVLRGYLYTGARLMELPAVTWDQVTTGAVRMPNLKTVRSRADSHRIIPLHPELVADLEAARARGDARPWEYPGDWKQQVRLHLIRYARAAGIPWLTKVHTLRATFASHLVQKGVSIYVVSKLLGHASVVQTEAAYAYLAPDNMAQAVTVLDFEK